MKKQISFLISAALIVGNTMGVYGANFSDINDLPWAGAATYVNEVADAGIMVGSTVDGKQVFKGKDAVTLVETTQLVYSLLEKTGYLKTATGLETKWEAVMKGYNIPQWAYKGVSYCLENAIVAADDLKAFMSGTKSMGAKREQVAYIIGRALQTVDGDLTGGGAVSFKDAAKISAVAIPYVELLNKQGIFTGDTDGNFNPTATINRAEMSVIISKSLAKINELKATDMPVIDTMPEINGGTGTTTVPGTVPGTTTDMPVINGIGNASGVVYEVQENGANRLIVLNAPTGNVGYMGDGNMAISYSDGSSGVLSNVKAGDSVIITFENSKIITLVNNSPKVTNTPTTDDIKTKGVIADVDSREIRLSGGDSLYIDRDVTIKIDDKSKDIDDLIEAYEDNDEVYAELELNSANDVTYIKATIEDDDDDDDGDGDITSISSSKIKVDGKQYTLADEDDLTIDITDGDDEINDLDDLIEAIEDDEKTINVTLKEKDDEVTKISGEVTEVSGEIVSVDEGDEEIEIKTEGGNKFTYPCSGSISIKIDGDSLDLEEFEELASEEDITVDLKLSNDKVTKVTGDID